MKICHKFLGGEATKLPHRPAHQTPVTNKSIIGADNIEAAGIQQLICNAHICKTGMVHQNQTGLIFHSIQTLDCVFQFAAAHSQFADRANDALPDKAGLCRFPVFRTRQCHNLFIIHIFDGCFQTSTSSHINIIVPFIILCGEISVNNLFIIDIFLHIRADAAYLPRAPLCIFSPFMHIFISIFCIRLIV